MHCSGRLVKIIPLRHVSLVLCLCSNSALNIGQLLQIASFLPLSFHSSCKHSCVRPRYPESVTVTAAHISGLLIRQRGCENVSKKILIPVKHTAYMLSVIKEIRLEIVSVVLIENWILLTQIHVVKNRITSVNGCKSEGFLIVTYNHFLTSIIK